MDQGTYHKALREDQERQAAFERRLETGGIVPFSTFEPSTGVSSNVNGGKLNLLNIVASADNVNYVAMALFNWETMPTFRGKDAFGITRDTDTKVNGNNASGGYSYYYQMWNSNTTYIGSEEYHPLSYNALQQDNRGYGYAYEVRILSDIPSSSSGSPGVPGPPKVRYTSMLGFVSYEGYVNSASVRGVNHWATYAHQNIKLIVNPSFNFSVPFSAGFSITVGFGWTYKQVIDTHNWRIK